MSNRLPNFLIIGAARTGTTSLYYYLKQHPQIFMSPRKEPRFFAFEGKKEQKGHFGSRPLPSYSTRWEEYIKLFDKVKDEKIIGEASTVYLYHPDAPKRIQRYLGESVTMVAILRNPIERAISHYMYNLRRGAEPGTTLEEAIKAEEDRIAQGWAEFFHYKRMGLYGQQLQRYFDIFRPDNIKVFLYEDFQKAPMSVVKQVFDFLKIESSFIPDMSKVYNVSGSSRFPLLSFLIRQTPRPVKRLAKALLPGGIRYKVVEWEMWRNVRPVQKLQISPEIRKSLLEYYRQDILKLQELLDRDLSHWLQEAEV